MRRWTVRAALLALLAGVWSGCGGGSEGGEADTTPPADVVEAGDQVAPDSAQPDTSTPDSVEDVPLLQFLTDDVVTAIEQSSYPIQVRAYGSQSFEAVADLALTFSLSGEGDAALDVTQATTDEGGMAEVTFSAGTAVGATYTLSASAAGAQPVSITINVMGLATGSVVVTPALHFPEQGGESLTLWVVPGVYVCGETGPLDKPANTYKEAVLASLAEPATIDGLPEGPRYAVVGLVTGADGKPVAGGCKDSFPVFSQGEPTAVTLDLQLLDVNATGTYAVEVATSFAPWVDAGLADVPAHLGAHFSDAGLAQGLHDGLFAALDEMVHTQHSGFKAAVEDCDPAADPPCDPQEWCAALMHDELDANLDQHLTNLPAWWEDLADFYDVATVLASDVRLHGEIEVKAHVFTPPAHYEYEWRPLSIELPDCGGATCLFPVADLATTTFRMELEPVDVQGTIPDHDQVAVDPLTLDLDPNRLALLVLTEILAPMVVGTHDLYGAFDAHFACQSLAPMFSTRFRTCIWAGSAEIQGLCEDWVEAYNAPLHDWLNPLATRRELTLTQALTATDADGDLVLETATGPATWSIEGAAAPLEGTSTWSRP